MYRCESCGFEADPEHPEGAGERIVAGVVDLNEAVRAAPDPARRGGGTAWSPLEYLCHVRDVLLVQRERVLRARREDTPQFAPMGCDERVEHDGYAEQDPEDVTRQAADAAYLFSNVLARLGPEDWQRRVVYNFPTPMEHSLGWVAVHTVHEVEHHLRDVREQTATP